MVGKLRNEAAALAYLQLSCVPQSSDRQGLSKQWQDAKKKLGEPVKNAGNPDIRAVGDEHGEYLDRLKSIKQYTPFFAEKNCACLALSARKATDREKPRSCGDAGSLRWVHG